MTLFHIYTCMDNHITSWIKDSINGSDKNWLSLVFRVDSFVLGADNSVRSPWHKGLVSPADQTLRALSWTITECRRKHDRKMKFAGFYGGEPSIGVFPHIHAVIERPTHITQHELTNYLDSLWTKKLHKLLHQQVIASVKSQSLNNTDAAVKYFSRYEGNTFSFGDEKVIINNSFYM